MNNFLENLNPEQLKAVLHQDGPRLIVAGAGTGKTTVITRRIAYLIKQGKAKPEEILALTFTEKAAGEMAERVEALLPYGYSDLWISTFHGFAERLLKEHGLAIGLPGDFKLLNEFEQWALVRKNLDKFELDYYRPLGNPTKFIHALIKHFSRAKDEDIGPRQYVEYAEGLKEDLDGMLSGTSSLSLRGAEQTRILRFAQDKLRNPRSSDTNVDFNQRLPRPADAGLAMTDMQEVSRLNEVANAYHVYQQLLLDNNCLDFGDLINYVLKLFRERPAILEKYRRRFKYILLDEFQDTNWAQYELVKVLAAPANNLVVVGDDDQCLPGGSLILTEQGKKRIDKIQTGERVVTAVGKGYLSYSRVNRVIKNVKQAKLITFITASGKKITLTDNHKMFCHVLSGWQNRNLTSTHGKKRYFYVYLMYKQELGWRLGMTNDLVTRLKLERSADLMVAIGSYESEAEARYNETLLSLKYSIPTVCFQERDGVMTRREWSEKLYEDLNVDSAVRKLAKDLGIDLSAHQVCLAGVNRGGKVRIKINLEMCHRNYRSKYAKGIFLTNPKVLHQLTVETSHEPTSRILRDLGFNLVKAKGGHKLRITSTNLSYLGKMALKIKKVTGGIIENQIKVATDNIQHKKALVIPAGNVLPGMFLPVVKDNKIIYEQIIKRQDKHKKLAVYDLEVDLTHNFVADNIIIHNSIYKFRGASLSNILQFNKDYPAAAETILVKNYRSTQNILDLAYEFIKQNNPNRLEWQLEQENKKAKRRESKLNKKLIAENKSEGAIEVIQGADLAEEVKLVVDKIMELKKRDKTATLNDFAILVRANDSANDFMAELDRRGIGYIFGASRGLYAKPVIMDATAYFKLLDNYHESAALWRVLNLPFFDFSERELVELNHLAAKKAWSLYEVLNNSSALKFDKKLVEKIKPVLALIAKHLAMAREKSAVEILQAFLEDSGYLKFLTSRDNQKNLEAINLLNQFLKRLQAFEAASDDKSVKAFLAELNLEREAGEAGSLAPDLEAGPEAVRILTVHGAKGLEFKYVFIANLVDKRFPTIERGEPIELPDALVKEILPEGDIHLEEERRLFYVAMTRAKTGLYFSWAPDYGGKVKKKASRFLVELGMAGKEAVPLSKRDKGGLTLAAEKSPLPPFAKGGLIPNHFSYSQLAAYSACPYQYRFAHILKIPTRGKEQFSFGKTLHAALQKLFILINEKKGLGQAELFGGKKPAGKNAGVDFNEILKLYEQSWVDDWYESKKKKQQRREQGKEILKVFYEKHKDNWPEAIYLEKNFNWKISVGKESHIVRGTIDRIDKVGPSAALGAGGLKLVDYKTGRPKDKLTFNDKEQLLIYQLAAGELFREEVKALAFYYLDDNSEVEFLGSAKDLEKIKAKIIGVVQEIKQGKFPPRPGQLCVWCDFREICEYRQ